MKLLDASPVADLVLKTVFYLPQQLVLPILGILEVAIGLALLFRVFIRTAVLLLVVQLAGTLTLLVIRPQDAFQNGNPLLLTQTGEFVIKNLVLIAASLAIGSTVRRRTETIRSQPKTRP